MALDSLMYDIDETVYFEEGFLDLIDSHMHLFKNSYGTRVESTRGFLSGRHNGDLNGFLDHINISKRYHYVIMRVNDMTHTGDLSMLKEEIMLPDLAMVDTLANVYKNKKTA